MLCASEPVEVHLFLNSWPFSNNRQLLLLIVSLNGGLTVIKSQHIQKFMENIISTCFLFGVELDLLVTIKRVVLRHQVKAAAL